MDASSVSPLWYMRSKPLGKVRRRVQALRVPCSDLMPIRPVLDLSHNESARLAVDCLLSRGVQRYRDALNAEGEVDFLSDLEKKYILENGSDGNAADPCASEDGDCEDLESVGACSDSVSTDSDPTVTGLDQSSVKDVKWNDPVTCELNVEVYFQSDSRGAGMKDLVREFIRKATVALAIVMDSFSDVELLCDLLEASRKRNVAVHLLLDHLNLNLFVTMWQELKLNGKNFPKLSVRSINGQTYCAKTGRKLTGQITESFIITDWTEVLTGSYSFSWLSWQVHRNLAILVKGNAATPFHQEFHRLHSSSTPVPGFVTFITVPQTLAPKVTSHTAQSDNTGISKSKSSKAKAACLWAWTEDAQMTKPLVQRRTQESVSAEKQKHTVIGVSTQHGDKTHVKLMEKDQKRIQSHSDTLGKTHVSYNETRLVGLTLTTTAEKNTEVQESNPQHAANPAHGQRSSVYHQSTLKKNSDLNYESLGAEGLFFQQSSRNRLTKPSGLAAGVDTQRGPRTHLLHFKPKVELQSDNPSASHQKQAKLGLQFPFTHSRGHTSGLQTKVSSLETRRQDQRQRHHQVHHELHPTMEAPGSKLTSPATGTQHLQLHASFQQAKHPPWLNWMIQSHTARPRPVARTNSFDSTYGTGGQVCWRPTHSDMNSLLGRSKSMTERRTAGFTGAGLNPNTTRT